MRSHYRFMRTREGITRFAMVTVHAQVSSSWEIVLDPSLGRLMDAQADAVRKGISAAANEYEKHGGKPHRVFVESIVETAADSSIDAIFCAAAVAAWKCLGGEEAEALISFADDKWHVTFEVTG